MTIHPRPAPAGAAAAAPAPLLSVCIPTWNRARFLGPLLARLAAETADMRDLVEIIVSDNASEDGTPEVVAAAGMEGALRYFRHAENVGGVRNYDHALAQARGRWTLYLADDDVLVWPGVLAALRALSAVPDAVALYAPWLLVDLVDDRVVGRFYDHPEPRVFRRGDRAAHARFVVEHRVFSEIAIFRTDVLRRVAPAVSDVAFWAFTIPAELMTFGAVLYAPEPFYGSVTRHPGADDRSQAGHEEAMVAWDRYRGGVEHLIGLARPALGPAEADALRGLGDRLVEERMLVALRLRFLAGRDAVQSYFLASRLRGLGREADLPVPMAVLRVRAGIAFLDGRAAERVGAARLTLAGAFPDETVAAIAAAARLPVARLAPGEVLGPSDVALVSGEGLSAAEARAVAGAGFAIAEADLMAKFP